MGGHAATLPEDKMLLEYTGRKPGIHLTFPWMKEAVMLVPLKGFEVDDDDALKLINDYPEIFREFQEDPLQKFIREQKEADAAAKAKLAPELMAQSGQDAQVKADDDDQQLKIVDEDKYKDVTFEVKEGAYLCPLCDKTYKENRGRGKAMLISHLEKDHAEKWAEMLLESSGEEPINY